MGKTIKDLQEMRADTLEFAKWLLEGYGDTMTLKDIGQGASYRLGFIRSVYETMISTVVDESTLKFFLSFFRWEEEGLLDFSFLE